MIRTGVLLLACWFSIVTAYSQGWWKTEPLRLIQTNLRETDSTLDPVQLAEELSEYPANTLLFSVGGIVAHYPTKVEFHYPSEYLREGKDLVGSMIREAHRRGIRVIGRFDFSRARRAVYEAHPEWFFKNSDGRPVQDDNDLYSSCINGGYYHEKAIEILSEALERYPVDGLFFNWFGNIRWDYKGNDIGLCHCDECRRRFQEKYKRDIPDEPDQEYEQFLFDSSREVARRFRELIKQKRPDALFMTYIQEYTDGIVDEADFYKWRPFPRWIYSASENVNRALNTRPEKMSFNLVMPYQEMRYRFASTPGDGLRALLYQNIAHGAFPAFVLLGTPDQPDKTAFHAVRPVFKWHAEHENLLTGQENLARVVLFAHQDPGWNSQSPDYRGFIKLLSELHIPFRITNRKEFLDVQKTDLVIVPFGKITQEIRDFVKSGGALLAAGTTHPGMAVPPQVKHWTETKSSYMRIENHQLFPSLKDTSVLFWEGDYLEVKPHPGSALTLIPPSQFGPPDKVSTLSEKTQKPGLILDAFGQGKFAFIPWNLGSLYYYFGNDKHRLFISDLVDHLLEEKKQVITNVHPAVEMTLMKSKSGEQTLVHLINLIGHSGTSFDPAVELRDLELQIQGRFRKATAIRLEKNLIIESAGVHSRLVVPRMLEYEVIVLE